MFEIYKINPFNELNKYLAPKKSHPNLLKVNRIEIDFVK